MSKGIAAIIFLVIIAIISISALLWYKQYKSHLQSKLTENSLQNPSTSTASTSKEQPIQTVDTGVYENPEIGFKFNYPTKAVSVYGECKKDSDGYFTTIDALLPVKVFEGNKMVFIAPEFFYKPTNEQELGDYLYHKDCIKVETNTEMLEKREGPDDQIVQFSTASNDTEINTFISQVYGDKCSFINKKEKGGSLYEMEVQRSEKNICGNGYAYFFYNSIKKNVIAYIYGQIDCSNSDVQEEKRCIQINEIRNSFRGI